MMNTKIHLHWLWICLLIGLSALSAGLLRTTVAQTETATATRTPIPISPTVRVTTEPTITKTPLSTTPLATSRSINAVSQQPIAVVEVLTANLRGGPGTDYQLVGEVKRDDRLPIIGQEGEGENLWYRVTRPDGEPAWIYFRLVSVYSSTSNVQVASTSESHTNPTSATSSTIASDGLQVTTAFIVPTNTPLPSSPPMILSMSHQGTCEGFSLLVEWQDINGDADEISIAPVRSNPISGNGGVFEWTNWACAGSSCTAQTIITDKAGNVSQPFTYIVTCP